VVCVIRLLANCAITKRSTGAAGVVGFEINVDHGRPVILVVRRQNKELFQDFETFRE